ncbi:hypothetical protein AB0C51_24415 [Streptomyces pathocidini]|uniref:hypothetical protein n=1 Tax=Streptomyces pathocidini TaxID=1650571 RepID=UPI0033C3CC61
MVRNILGSAVALAGAAAAVWSPFRAWYGGRLGRDVRIEDLFGGITAQGSGLFASLLAPMLAAAVLALLGVVLRSRLVVALAGLVALAFTVLWMVRQGQAAGSLTAGGDGGLGPGVALAVGGGLLMLLGAAIMRGRPRGRRARGRVGGPEPHESAEPHETRPYEEPHAQPPYGGTGPPPDATQPMPRPPPPDDPWSQGHPHRS